MNALRVIRREPGLAFLTVLVNQLTDGQDVDIVLLVRDRQLQTKRDGGEYLKLGLADRTGSVSAIIRDDIATVGEVCTAGCAVRVAGRYSVHPRYGAGGRRATRCAPPSRTRSISTC